jgi:hypothetical protein
MKRFPGTAMVVVLVLTLAGCGSSGTRPVAGEATSTPVATATVIPGPKTWKAMPMGIQEKANLAAIARPVALYVSAERKAGRKPAALAGKTPRFVGYQVQIWSTEPGGTFQSTYIDVIDGRIDAIGDVQRPLEAKMVRLLKKQVAIHSSKVVPLSAGEKEAVAKAVAWANGAFPGSAWNAEISAYDFYYSLGGNKYVLFTSYATDSGYRVLVGPMVPPEPGTGK